MRVAVLAARSSGHHRRRTRRLRHQGRGDPRHRRRTACQAVFLLPDLRREGRPNRNAASSCARQFYLLNQTTKVLNRDWLGAGSYSDGKLDKIAGIKILMSNHLPNKNIASAVDGEKNTYFGDFTNTLGLCMQSNAIATVKLKDLTVQQSGHDFNIVYQSTLMVAKYAMGHGILNPSFAIELSTAAKA
ncbi:MAG: hypothetical protein ACLUPV_05995 [Bilophila wadsworthia]